MMLLVEQGEGPIAPFAPENEEELQAHHLRQGERNRWARGARHIAQHHIDARDPEQREALQVFLDFTDDELDDLAQLMDWICDHGLERAIQCETQT